MARVLERAAMFLNWQERLESGQRVRSHRNGWVKFDKCCRAFKLNTAQDGDIRRWVRPGSGSGGGFAAAD